MDIPIDAPVHCLDGSCGESTVVIFDPTTQEITHFVVQEKSYPHIKRLVPVKFITETTPNSIKLNCSGEELAKMDRFVEHQFIQTDKPYDQYATTRYLLWPYAYPLESNYIDIQLERVPPGELAIHRGAHVQAVDGNIGVVDEFLIDPITRHVTYLILREGHLWGKKDVTIPIEQIDHISDDTVFLKLDKSSIEALPAIPVRRWI